MIAESRHVGVTIGRSAGDVYEFVSDPANLPAWASGLGGTIERVGDEWIARMDGADVAVRFADRNEWGVLDHDVRLPTGEWFHNSVRVTPNGDGSDVVFTVRRVAGVSDADFERDVATVTADLVRLKQVLER